MARKENKVVKLRKDVDKLRKSYSGAMSSANQAVQDGFEKLVEHELTAIKAHYEAAIKNLKQLRKGGDPRDLATAQLKLLQETIDRIMNNAKESLSILDATRKQISADVRKELEATSKPASTRKTTARKTTTANKTTTAKKKPAARKAPAKKTATKKTAAKKTTASRATTSGATTAKKTTTTRKAPAKRRAPAKKTAVRKTASKTASSTGSSPASTSGTSSSS